MTLRILAGIGVLAAVFLFWQLFKLNPPEEIIGPKLEAELGSSVSPPNPLIPKINFYPSDTLYQGEALRVEVENPEIQNPALSFRGKEYKFFEYQKKLNAVIPLAVDEPAGEASIRIGAKTLPLKILAGIFKVEEIPPPKPLTPRELAIRQEETKSIIAVYQSITPSVYFSSPFALPLDVLFETSPFGVQRVALGTGQKFQPHNGIDLRADIGTPVKAVNDGVVEIAEKYLLEGGFVILDHGLGINSVYLHLSKVLVDPGQMVKKGDIVGLSGGSGQSSGPHLHFTIKINGIAVEPLRFLELWK